MLSQGADLLLWALLVPILVLSTRNWFLMRRIRKNIAELKDSRMEMARTVSDFSKTADMVTARMREVVPLLEEIGRERRDGQETIARMSSLRGDMVEIARKAAVVADRLEASLRHCEVAGTLQSRRPGPWRGRRAHGTP